MFDNTNLVVDSYTNIYTRFKLSHPRTVNMWFWNFKPPKSDLLTLIPWLLVPAWINVYIYLFSRVNITPRNVATIFNDIFPLYDAGSLCYACECLITHSFIKMEKNTDQLTPVNCLLKSVCMKFIRSLLPQGKYNHWIVVTFCVSVYIFDSVLLLRGCYDIQHMVYILKQVKVWPPNYYWLKFCDFLTDVLQTGV